LHTFEKFNEHLKICFNDNLEDNIVKLPEPGSKMKFKNFKNKLERPFIVYADCEATLKKIKKTIQAQSDENSDELISTELINKHIVNSCCYYFVCTFDSSRNRLRTFYGKNCLVDMLKELIKLSLDCIDEMRKNCQMKLSKEECKKYYSAKECYICNLPFGESKAHQKVRDHDHRTGEYRGAAHSCCNINYFCNRYLPVVFHNLRGYDSHLIIKEAWKLTNGDISVIPNSSENL